MPPNNPVVCSGGSSILPSRTAFLEINDLRLSLAWCLGGGGVLDQVAWDLRPIYTAVTEARFTEFAEKWGRLYPAIKRLWENA